jgi:hypothetical protein
MKRWVWLVTGIFLISSIVSFAQDPGEPDSLIIDSVDVDEGETVGFVPIYFVTDTCVGFVNVPITWSSTSTDNLVFPSYTLWFDVFQDWDETYDTVLIDEHLIRHVAWYDIGNEPNPALCTGGERVHGISLRFTILEGAEAQFVSIDTTRDPLPPPEGSPCLFGDTLGRYEWTPVVVPGLLNYAMTGIGDEEPLPTEFALKSNYPNPFNPLTKIDFELPSPEMVNIKIYNILGQNVVTLVSEYKEAGRYSVIWNSTNNAGQSCPSGIYFYRMTAGDFSETKKMMLLR